MAIRPYWRVIYHLNRINNKNMGILMAILGCAIGLFDFYLICFGYVGQFRSLRD